MLYLKPAIDVNALTQLQRLWGGSHDFVLGLLLWICAIPTYSFARWLTFEYIHSLISTVMIINRSYYGTEILYLPKHSGRLYLTLAVPIEPSQHVVFHRLLNFKRFQQGPLSKVIDYVFIDIG